MALNYHEILRRNRLTADGYNPPKAVLQRDNTYLLKLIDRYIRFVHASRTQLTGGVNRHPEGRRLTPATIREKKS